MFVSLQLAGDWIEDDHDDDSVSEDSDDSDAESVCSVSSSTAGDLTDTVYVGTFPSYVKEQQIRSHFSDFDKFIKKVCIKSKEDAAYAFVTFSSGEVADDARQILHGSKLLGKYPIKVNTAQQKISASAGKKRTKRKQETKVFIGNLPPHTKDVDVSNHFAKYRPNLIGNPEVKKMSKAGESSYCIAFLSFRSRAVALAAVEEMNKTKLLQRSIRVKLNKTKDSQQRAAQPVAATAGKPSKKLEDVSQKPVAVSQVCITGIPPNLDKEDLIDLLPDSSCLLSCKLRMENGDEKAADMSFTSADSASEAMELFHGKTFLGRTLQASVKNPPRSRTRRQKSKETSAGPTSKGASTGGQSSKGSPTFGVTIKVLNLPEKSTRKAIFHHFKEFVKTIGQVKVSENTALISFSSMEEAEQALARRHNTVFNGNVIGVIMEPAQASASQKLPSDRPEVRKKSTDSSYSTVKVSNLPKGWTGANVCNHFKQFGKIKNKVEVTQGRDETAPNFAFVTFFDQQHAHQALNLDGNWIEGTRLRVTMKETVGPQPVAANVAASPTGSSPLLGSQSTPHPFPSASHTPSPFPHSQTAVGSHLPPQSPKFPPTTGSPHLGFARSPVVIRYVCVCVFVCVYMIHIIVFCEAHNLHSFHRLAKNCQT